MSRVRSWIVVMWSVAISGAGIAAFAVQTDLPKFTVPAIMLIAVGALISMRVQGNLVGTVLLLGGSAWLIYVVAGEYAQLSLESAERLPGDRLAAWLGAWTGSIMPVSLAALMSLFPDGRLAGRRWIIVPLGGLVVLALVGAWNLRHVPTEVLTTVGRLDARPEYRLTDLAFGLGFLSIAPATMSLVVRYRKGSQIERHQIKWLLFVGALFASFFLSGMVISVPITAWEVGSAFLLGLFPVAVAVAVFKYRLYDIDRIISRAVAYGLVVTCLGVVFTTGVVLIPNILPIGDSSIAVAASTLVVAGCFDPVRRRARTWVDRRFNRSRYDAERVMDAFSGSLRDQVDPEELLAGWVRVVSTTMEPMAIAVWTRPPGASSGTKRERS